MAQPSRRLRRPELTQQIQTLPSGYSATLGYAYDPAGNRTRMTTPWGAFTYTYDAANRLTGITNPQSLIFTFAYDAAGRRTKVKLHGLKPLASA